MFSHKLLLVWAGILALSGMFLMGQQAWVPLDNAGESLILEWDANTEYNLAGYRLYYGQESSSYDYVLNVGKSTSCSVSGLWPGTWYFVLTATDYNGNESDDSNEVAVTLPLE